MLGINIRKIVAAIDQPKAMYLLFFVQMWESFSFFGMRVLLALYMINGLKFEDAKAFGIYAIYTSLAQCLGIFGGHIADKILGLRRAIYLGGIMIAIGHIILTFVSTDYALYLSLAFIAAGTGLFTTNCTALLGEFYKKNDSRRNAGYTLFYVGRNLGGFSAAVLCAFIADNYGWHYGFMLAAIGMFIGLAVLFKFRHILESKGHKPAGVKLKTVALSVKAVLLSALAFAVFIYFYDVCQYILLIAIIAMFAAICYRALKYNIEERSGILMIIVATLLSTLFYGFEEQSSSTIIVFADRFADKNFFGFTLPATVLAVFNPLTIILIGPIVAFLLRKFERNGLGSVAVFNKIALAFIIQSAAFAMLYTSSIDGSVTAYTIATSVCIIALSELFIGPVVYSVCAEKAPQGIKATMMGLVMLGTAMSRLLSGFLSQYMSVVDGNYSVYSIGFINITIACIALAVFVYAINFVMKKRA